MDSDTIADLKQFIGATMRQELSGVEKRLDKIDERLDGIDERFDEVLNAIGTEHQRLDAKIDDHEGRIVKLEHKAA